MYVSLSDNQPMNLMDDVTSAQMAAALNAVMSVNIPFSDNEVFAYTVPGITTMYRASVRFNNVPGSGINLLFKTDYEESVYHWSAGSTRLQPLHQAINNAAPIVQTLTGIDRAHLVNQALRELLSRQMRMAGLRR